MQINQWIILPLKRQNSIKYDAGGLMQYSIKEGIMTINSVSEEQKIWKVTPFTDPFPLHEQPLQCI